jgi:hypothetical protein
VTEHHVIINYSRGDHEGGFIASGTIVKRGPLTMQDMIKALEWAREALDPDANEIYVANLFQ